MKAHLESCKALVHASMVAGFMLLNSEPANALGWKAVLRDETNKTTKDYFPSIENKSTIKINDLNLVCTAAIQKNDEATKSGVDGQECLTVCIPINAPNPQNEVMSLAIGTKAVALKGPNNALIVHQSVLHVYDRNLDNKYTITCTFD